MPCNKTWLADQNAGWRSPAVTKILRGYDSRNSDINGLLVINAVMVGAFNANLHDVIYM